MREKIYFVGFLLAAIVLLYLGHDLFRGSVLVSWGLSFAGTTTAGVVALTQGLAVELGHHNINVNAVGPGVIGTPMMERNVAPEMRQSVQKKIPLRHIGVPEDVANAVLFLASDEASYITGQCLYVCGGLSASAGLQ